MDYSVSIQWTTTATRLLDDLPRKVAKGIVAKISNLKNSDPRKAGKALVGPFLGCRRITYGRFRAIFQVTEQRSKKTGKLALLIKVVVVAVGIRKSHDKKDVYKLAMRLVELGLIPASIVSEPVPDHELN